MSKLIAANWKMYPTLSDSLVLAASLRQGLEKLKGVDVVIAPPIPWLMSIAEGWGHRLPNVSLAAQNVWPEDQGAFTGETSAYLLKSVVKYAIVGHSERRQLVGESDELIHHKLLSCLRWGIQPILCVGEKKRIFTSDNLTDSYQLARTLEQLAEGLYAVRPDDLDKIVIAYEPLWAIAGASRHPAKPEYVAKVIGKLRDRLGEKYGKVAADNVRIIYGGSAEAANTTDYLREPGVDGLLVGSMSTKAKDFLTVCQTAAALRTR